MITNFLVARDCAQKDFHFGVAHWASEDGASLPESLIQKFFVVEFVINGVVVAGKVCRGPRPVLKDLLSGLKRLWGSNSVYRIECRYLRREVSYRAGGVNIELWLARTPYHYSNQYYSNQHSGNQQIPPYTYTFFLSLSLPKLMIESPIYVRTQYPSGKNSLKSDISYVGAGSLVMLEYISSIVIIETS